MAQSSYDFQKIEKKWRQRWRKQSHKISHNITQKPKFYVLDMFPYPSGSGLHVGHALGYVATDIVARYKRSKGYHVLHPMGFDAFGLPTEQFAIETGKHPAQVTETNIKNYTEQLKQLGLYINWERSIRTTDPAYYRWTQWIFIQLFKSWYNKAKDTAESIDVLVQTFAIQGNKDVEAACDADTPQFSATQWQDLPENEKQAILLKYRLAYLAETKVNWCPALGTVLANEEVKGGFSERGTHPVVRKKMLQWSLRTTAYAERFLVGLDNLAWPKPIKEMQHHWIGKSVGVEIDFDVQSQAGLAVTAFTTHPETVFGMTYLALAPEHPLVDQLCTAEQRATVQAYCTRVQKDTERTRMQQLEDVTGVFTGAHVLHPFTGQPIPIWVTAYALPDYGTGAVMGVPAHDERDHAFAKHFELPILQVITSSCGEDNGSEGKLQNADFLDGLSVAEARHDITKHLKDAGIGRNKVYYKLRDAAFGRWRYWGEPIPIYYKEGMPYPLEEKELPLKLPEIADYQPNADGISPLEHLETWETPEGHPLECSTMPAYAGSSWYFLRYMDPHNTKELVGEEAQRYWQAVDLYVGGAEHTTGHLLYARFCSMFLYDLGYLDRPEPFVHLLNQGMIQGRSHLIHRIKGTQKFVSYGLRQAYDTVTTHIPSRLVKGQTVDLDALKAWRPDLSDAVFLLEEGQYLCDSEIEKMSKSKYNTVNPSDVIEEHGTDALRLYLMFLGPITHSKPWCTRGIEGIARFMKKLWKLFHHDESMSKQEPTHEEWQVIHGAIRQVTQAIESHAFNTAVSALMVCTNRLSALHCNKHAVLTLLVCIIAPFAPHMAEELWELLGNKESVVEAEFPVHDEAYLKVTKITYPVAINGKTRTLITVPADASREDMESTALADAKVQKWLKEDTPQKIFIVPGKMINLVI